MSIFNDEKGEAPEDRDPAYENPIGKIPERTPQPFDFPATSLHSEGERNEFQNEITNEAKGELLEKRAGRAASWTKGLARREELARDRYQRCKAGSEEEASLLKQWNMYSHFRDVWNTEMAMLVDELREEIRQEIKRDYLDDGKQLRSDLAWDRP